MSHSNMANQTTTEETTILHPVCRSPRLNPILQILPDGVHYFNYGGVNYRCIYRLIKY